MPNQGVSYQPDFEAECRICLTSPTVKVQDPQNLILHINQFTDLCGVCFFLDHKMVDWQLWNEA
jgi:hypothetical protein